MKVVYHCFGGTHTSAVAAAIHLGQLPRDRAPRADELLQVPLFDRASPSRWGLLTEVGQDREGHRVFVMGRGPGGDATVRALVSGLRLGGGPQAADGLLLVDTLPAANWLMRIGGYLSRRVGLVRLGRPLVIWGTQKAYPRLVQLVRQVEQGLTRGEDGPPSRRDPGTP